MECTVAVACISPPELRSLGDRTIRQMRLVLLTKNKPKQSLYIINVAVYDTWLVLENNCFYLNLSFGYEISLTSDS
jgi:hypothetical protein